MRGQAEGTDIEMLKKQSLDGILLPSQIWFYRIVLSSPTGPRSSGTAKCNLIHSSLKPSAFHTRNCKSKVSEKRNSPTLTDHNLAFVQYATMWLTLLKKVHANTHAHTHMNCFNGHFSR